MDTFEKYLNEGVINFDKPTDNMKLVLKTTFPSYTGRKIKIVVDDFPTRIDSYWDGGSKTTYSFFDISSKRIYNVGSNHPMFERDKPRTMSRPLLGVILVAHSIFMGKDTGITFYVMQEDYEWLAGSPQLEDPKELTDNQKIVLHYTKSLKSSYAGVKNYRFSEANRDRGIKLNDWNEAKDWLIKNGYLNAAGAITTKGRNVIQNIRI
jgi:hypothetical protein